MTDPRDAILQRQVPTVMVPVHGTLEPLQVNGHRFLAAADGVHIEVHRPWLHVVWPAARSRIPLPYGPAPDCGIAYPFDWKQLMQLVDAFTGMARARLPNECGTWIAWSETEQTLRFVESAEIKAGPGRLDYRRPQTRPGEHLVCDLHSHGRLSAFFSATDDADDAGDVKFAAVVGNLAGTIDLAMGLCLPGGFFIDADEWENPA